MAVMLRLKRFGRRNRPAYRIVAIDKRLAQDGKPIEEIGYYDPLEKDEKKASSVDADRAIYWLSVGAQPSRTVGMLLKRAGIDPVPGKPEKVEA